MAHVTAGVANPVPASGQLDNTRLQHLIQQLQAYVHPSTSVQPQQLSTVNETGYMAPPNLRPVLFHSHLLAFVSKIIFLLFNTNVSQLSLPLYHLILGSLTVGLLHMSARIYLSLVVPRL